MKLTNIIILAGLIFSINFTGNVIAENRAGALTLSPMVGGHLFEGDQNLKQGTSYGLGLGHNIDWNWGVETVVNYIDTKSRAGGNVDAFLYRLDVLYHLFPDKKLIPYFAAGVGGITFDPDSGDNDSDFLVNYGGGVKYFLNDFTFLRGDIRHIISFDDTYNNLAYTLGLTFLFGGEKLKTVVQNKDSDGDGVYNLYNIRKEK